MPNLFAMLVGAIRALEGLTMIVTFGRFCPRWELAFVIWRFERVHSIRRRHED